jgi:FtsH-binding integral membrane protein
MNRVSQRSVIHTQRVELDQRFRTYTASVYGNMGVGLLLTAFTSYMFSASAYRIEYIFKAPLFYVVMCAPLVMAVYYNFKWHRLKAGTTRALFFLYALLIGLSMASIFIVYVGESIARIFLIAASMFGATSLYGYTTNRDLTGMGSFMIMGLLGFIIAMVINFFMRSSGLQTGLSVLGVVIFTALTAGDVQRLKNVYHQLSGHETLGKVAIKGAFMLYLDFINTFIHLLYPFGKRRS